MRSGWTARRTGSCDGHLGPAASSESWPPTLGDARATAGPNGFSGTFGRGTALVKQRSRRLVSLLLDTDHYLTPDWVGVLRTCSCAWCDAPIRSCSSVCQRT